jgi:CspA family cold shock protein
MSIRTGIVKFFNRKKGFGFIILDDDQRELFFHATSLASGRNLNSGDKVEFEEGEGKFGLAALKVSKLDDTGASSSESAHISG